MPMRATLTLVLVSAVLLAGCASTPPPAPPTGPLTGALGSCEGEAPAAATPKLARIETTMGAFTVALAVDGAPNTTQNFINLALADFYDGVKFHRVIGPDASPPDGFMIQTGDDLTKDANVSPDRWGTGGSNETIEDEFSPDLQHDAAGILSMANKGPDSGSSQFFVTLAPTRHLDDRHAVFGRVVEGMDVVRAIGNLTTNADGVEDTADDDRPVDPPAITDVRIEDGPVRADATVRSILDEKTVGVGRSAQVLVLGTNAGTARDRLAFGYEVPAGWVASYDLRCADVLPGAGRVSVLTVTPPSTFEGNETLRILVGSEGGANASAEVRLSVGEVGPELASGSKVRANYVGVLENGRMFDTSLFEVAHDETMPTASSFCLRDTPLPCNRGSTRAYAPFDFTVGRGVIEGFSQLATGARVGETPAGRIAPADAYGVEPGGHPLAGKTLLFELQILELVS